jgi:hypothetical protein
MLFFWGRRGTLYDMKATTEKRRGRPSMTAEEKKKSTSFYLSDETREELKSLAAAMRISQASVIEILVSDAARTRNISAVKQDG